MQDFTHLLTTRPHDIRAVFIADLHLSAHNTTLNRAFVDFIKDLGTLPALNTLYILGDFLDSWVGDDAYLSLSDTDKQSHWLTPIIHALTHLSHKNSIILMHGNRDFTISQALCDVFGATLVQQPYFLYGGIRIEHGDGLCTDDKTYQRYRKIIQNPIILKIILKLPLAQRQKLARRIRGASYSDKINKTATIMDVNTSTVTRALAHHDLLIHGHTHRPARHVLGHKTRLVLGDWRTDDTGVSAVVAVSIDNSVDLWHYRWH